MNDEQRDKRRKKILEAYAETGNIRRAARSTGHSINTVRRVLRGDDTPKVVQSRPKRPSKLDAFRAVIQRLVLEDKLSATLVFEELRALGYRGGQSILKDYVRQIRPAPKLRVTTVMEHAPGDEGQVDWSPYAIDLGGERTVVHAFSLVLPFSRFIVVRFALDERLETLIRLHEEAFSMLGAVPRRITYDNMTTVGRHVGAGEVQLNANFEAYAKLHGFEIQILPPGRPTLHGSVERPFHYLENNFLKRARLRFDSLSKLNEQARWWCEHVANVRVHGTTRERPVDRMVRERALMLPLSGVKDMPWRSAARTVQRDYCIAVDTNRYSVHPKHVGQAATIKLYAERLEILIAGELAAVHQLCRERYQRVVLPEHEDAFKRIAPSRRLLEQAFLRLGPAARDYYEGLRVQRGGGAGYHLQRILRLADRHGTAVVLGAMAHAARFGNYSASAVARVIAGRQRLTLPPQTTSALPAQDPRQRVLRWLEGLHVEERDLADYDRMLAKLDEPFLASEGPDLERPV